MKRLFIISSLAAVFLLPSVAGAYHYHKSSACWYRCYPNYMYQYYYPSYNYYYPSYYSYYDYYDYYDPYSYGYEGYGGYINGGYIY